jgi:hypothetical protein
VTDRRWVSGQIDISVLLAFGPGAFFLLILLVFVVTFTDLTDTAKQVFVTILSIAAAGVGAVIPGLLKIKMPYAEACGALAVFLLVYLNEPAVYRAVERLVGPPPHPGDQKVGEYLLSIDQSRFSDAWGLVDQEAKGLVIQSESAFNELYSQALSYSGKVVSRAKVGEAGISSPTGFPLGFYRTIKYEIYCKVRARDLL